MNTETRRHALITGASSGIGKGLADQFARAGIHLIVTARKAESLASLAEGWRRLGVDVTCLACDLSVPGAAANLHAQVLALGIDIDFLVNNAGVGLYGEFSHSDLQAELAMMRLNMLAPTELTKYFLPQLITRRGSILNVASTAAFQPGPYMAVYYASKAYLLSWSEALAEELAGSGVSVTALCPGPTASGFQDQAAMQASKLVKGRRMPSADSVAALGYRALRRGRRVYIPGWMNWLLAQSVRFTPRRWVTALVKSMSAPV